MPGNSCTAPRRHGSITHQPEDAPYGGFGPDLPCYPPLSHGSSKFEVDDRSTRGFRALPPRPLCGPPTQSRRRSGWIVLGAQILCLHRSIAHSEQCQICHEHQMITQRFRNTGQNCASITHAATHPELWSSAQSRQVVGGGGRRGNKTYIPHTLSAHTPHSPSTHTHTHECLDMRTIDNRPLS